MMCHGFVMDLKATETTTAPGDERAKSDVAEFIECRDGQAYPKNSRFSVKHIAYLYIYCRKHPFDIVARYPKTLSHADVHLALAHYYRNKEGIDAEIKRDQELNARDVLAGG